VRPESVSDTLSHVYIHTMLFPLYSLNPHRTFIVVIIIMFFLSSHASLPTRRLGGTPRNFIPFSDPFVSAAYLLRRPSITPTSNTFVPPTQCSTFKLPSFAGKMQQATTRPRRLAAVCWHTDAPKILDPELPNHAPGISHSIKDIRQGRTSPGSRTSVCIVSARRNIWTYTSDLVKTAESQATRYSTVERSGSRTKCKSIGTIA